MDMSSIYVVGVRPYAQRFLLICVLLVGPMAASAVCVGDCDGDGRVTIGNLILGTNIALGMQPPSACPAFQNSQGQVGIAQLVRAVGNALNGCPSEPTATITPTVAATPTSTPEATATHTAAATPMGTATASATQTSSPTVTQVTLQVGSAAVSPGMVGSFDVLIATAGEDVDVLQNELHFSPDAPIVEGPDGDPDCLSNTGSLATVFLPIGCTVGADCEAIRVTYARTEVPDGTVLYSCRVRVRESVTPGERIPLTCSDAYYVTSAIEEFSAACVDGVVQVVP